MEPQFELLLYNYKHYNAYTKHLQISTKIQRENAGNFPVESKSESGMLESAMWKDDRRAARGQQQFNDEIELEFFFLNFFSGTISEKFTARGSLRVALGHIQTFKLKNSSNREAG